jgi:hypothetical protein
MALGAWGYVQKPVGLAALQHTVSHSLRAATPCGNLLPGVAPEEPTDLPASADLPRSAAGC